METEAETDTESGTDAQRQLALACEAFAAFGAQLSDAAATDLVDRVAAGLAAQEHQLDLPLNHIFTPGTPGACGSLYTREIFMPAGSWVVSHIHRTAHPFVVLSGLVLVWTKEKGVETLTGGYLGITTPGTRRILYIVQDTVWATFHATELESVPEIERVLLEPHVNPYLPEKNNPDLNLDLNLNPNLCPLPSHE